MKCALIHKSYANENRMPHVLHNERYEFLGDAVLELSISDLLMTAFPEYPEGELSKLRAAIVNEQQLAQLADELSLGDFIYLGKGEELTGGRQKPSLLADAFEAVLGAVFIDSDFKKTHKIIGEIFSDILQASDSIGFLKDYKTRLQEESQGRFKQIPRYVLVNESGPDHNKRFSVDLYIGSELYGRGEGSNKKSAEQAAACVALQKIGVFSVL